MTRTRLPLVPMLLALAAVVLAVAARKRRLVVAS